MALDRSDTILVVTAGEMRVLGERWALQGPA
jgi:hypothetical protein